MIFGRLTKTGVVVPFLRIDKPGYYYFGFVVNDYDVFFVDESGNILENPMKINKDNVDNNIKHGHWAEKTNPPQWLIDQENKLKDKKKPLLTNVVNSAIKDVHPGVFDRTEIKHSFFPEADVANWTPFMGNNHNTVPNPYGLKYGGGISFFSYLNQPLTQSLWNDLVYRLQVAVIRIYRPNDSQWIDSGSKRVIIRLNENDLIQDIYYCP